MIKAFQIFLKSIVIQPQKSKFLLAVSGGIDSMVMLHLFQKSTLEFAVANINFKLRTKESDLDSEFVKNYCHQNNIKLYHKEFDTQAYANEHKISIQMAARDLRYQWFDELIVSEQLDYIAIGHHLDDQTETFFINLIRGTGIAGIHGIAKQKEKIIRPLLFTNRLEIEKYVAEQNITFREDSSNASDKYQRNYIRHHILPHFHYLRSDFSQSLNQSISIIKELEDYANLQIQVDICKILVNNNEELFSISIEGLYQHPFPKLLLYHALKEYNFNIEHINDILRLIEKSSSGKRVTSSSHQVYIERDELVIVKISHIKITHESYIIEDVKSLEKYQISAEFPYKGIYKIKDTKLAFLDFDKLNFPLTLRTWKNGDYFFPLGLNGKKRISDFFIDQKLSAIQKQNTLLLCSGEQIIWVLGYRIDERFAINNKTKHIIKLSYYGNY